MGIVQYIDTYMLSSLILLPVDESRILNSLRPSDTITLAQVMACCLTAPRYYLNQCRLIISQIQLHTCEGNLTRNATAINHHIYFENHLSKISFKSPRGTMSSYFLPSLPPSACYNPVPQRILWHRHNAAGVSVAKWAIVSNHGNPECIVAQGRHILRLQDTKIRFGVVFLNQDFYKNEYTHFPTRNNKT